MFIDERLPFKSKIAYGFAQASNSILSGIAIGAAITFYYNVKLGLSEELVSIAWLLFAFWNAANDPLFGILQERVNTDMGRRIPVLRFGAPLYAITFIICWFPFMGNTQIALFWNLLLVLFFVDSMFTMIGLVLFGLPAEMCLTQEARSNLGLYSIVLGATGGLLSVLLPLILLTSETSTELNPLFKPMMVLVGIVAGTVLFFSSFTLIENEYARTEEPLGFIESMVKTVKNREFLVFEASNFAYTLALTIFTGFLTYFMQYVMELEGLSASLPLVIVFGLMLLSTFFAVQMVKRRGLKRVYITGLLLASFGLILLFLAQSWLIPVIVSFTVVGISFGPIILINQLLAADIIDYDEIMTGKRRETTYAGMNALITKPSISIANALFLLVISIFGFNNELSEQLDSAVLGIRLGYTLIPAIFFVISALILLKWYTLDGKEWKAKKIELGKIHIQKEREYIEHLQKEGKISKIYQTLYGKEN
ncbi:MAG: MFS transporter [Promethearchaeota archaeon]